MGKTQQDNFGHSSSQSQARRTSVVEVVRMGEWKYGLCDYINPCNLMCLYSAYCHPCAIHDMAEEYEAGSGMINLVLGLIIPIFPLVKLRGEAREKSQIQGSVMEDCCTVFCCPGCAIIQLHKQIDPKTNILGLEK